jgi:hypothetical protein
MSDTPHRSALRATDTRKASQKPFWRVSFAGHHPQATQLTNVFRDLNGPRAIGAMHAGFQQHHQRSTMSAVHAALSATAAPMPVTRYRGVTPLDVDAGHSPSANGSSFDVVDGLPRSRPPSARSIGSVIIVGSPDSRTVRRVGSDFSLGSMAPTPRERSHNLADLDGCEARDTPTSVGSALSFPTVSANTPQASPSATRAATPRRPTSSSSSRPDMLLTMNRPPALMLTQQQLPAAAESLVVDTDDDTLVLPVPHTAATGPAFQASAAIAESEQTRSSIHFRVVDGQRTAVGLHRASWGHHSTRRASGPAFVNDAVSALFRVLNQRHNDTPATPPNSENDDDENAERDPDDDIRNLIETANRFNGSGRLPPADGATAALPLPDYLREPLDPSAPRWSHAAWRPLRSQRLAAIASRPHYSVASLGADGRKHDTWHTSATSAAALSGAKVSPCTPPSDTKAQFYSPADAPATFHRAADGTSRTEDPLMDSYFFRDTRSSASLHGSNRFPGSPVAVF